jgi:hypothetical protein
MNSFSDDNTYKCKICNFEMENNDKNISRHLRICEKFGNNFESNKTNITDELFSLDYIKTTDSFIPLTRELLKLQKNDNLYFLEEIDLSSQNLSMILNKKNINFEDLSNLKSMKLSNNLLKEISFIPYFKLLKILDLSNNKIENITQIESLANLEILNFSHNNITVISSLIKLTLLKELHLDNNKLMYTTSTFKTLIELRKLVNLSIENNPFLTEIQGYRYLFINKLKTIEILDSKIITEVDIDLAKEYVNTSKITNSSLYNVCMLPNTKQDSKADLIEVSNIKEIKSKGTVISKFDYKHRDNENKKITSFNKPKIQIEDSKKILELEVLNKQNDSKISSLELQIENLINLNKQLEEQLIFQKKEKEQTSLNPVIKNNTVNERELNLKKENEKLVKELEICKKDYYDLLFNYSTLKEDFEQLKINQRSNFNNTTVNTSHFKNSDNNRPQTAKIKDYDSIYNKSITNINLFQENPLFDNEDLYDKFRFNKKQNNEIKKDEQFSDEEINDLINKSITGINSIKDLIDCSNNESQITIISNIVKPLVSKKLPPIIKQKTLNKK